MIKWEDRKKTVILSGEEDRPDTNPAGNPSHRHPANYEKGNLCSVEYYKGITSNRVESVVGK